MLHVVDLYRYPIKGFTPETCESLTVLDEGRIAGDRVLGIRFANSYATHNAWSNKHEFVALVNTPGMACLKLQFDHQKLRVRIILEDSVLIDAGLNDSGRKQIAEAIQSYVLGLGINPLESQPDRIPLRVVGDGVSSHFQDHETGLITLHSRESLADVAVAVGEPKLSEHRFRSNIVIAGLNAWEEQNWVGRKIQIGPVEFEGIMSKTRCLATHANPETGQRDLPILKTLTAKLDQKKPTFAIALTTTGRGGLIRIGDHIRLLD